MNQIPSSSRHRLPTRQRSRSPISRPTTPLRPSSRSSFRDSQSDGRPAGSALDTLEPQFAELSDAMADLEANFMHLQLMHESLSRFGESFASFLYGLNMNAFVVDFPEVCNPPAEDQLQPHDLPIGSTGRLDQEVHPAAAATRLGHVHYCAEWKPQSPWKWRDHIRTERREFRGQC